ncbi:MAG: DinB family protein [Anaerolineales bacterium]|nr:DinB family protein [Anaerolineales bacterium]
MNKYDSPQVGALARLEALAQALEGQGQYNVAKLFRAAGASIVSDTAWKLNVGTEKEELEREVRNLIADLDEAGMQAELLEAMASGADAISDGRLPLIDETPHPYVCRTCGHIAMTPPSDSCPRCNARPRTFQRFPPVYWLEAMDPPEALEWLQRTPEQVLGLIDPLEEADLSRELIEGEWSIRELLIHLRDAQGVLEYRVNLLLSEDEPLIESQAVFDWATDGSAKQMTSMDIFETYRSSRQKTIERLQNAPLADWWRGGSHQEFGTVNVKQQVSYFATHELTHLPQLESLIERLPKG